MREMSLNTGGGGVGKILGSGILFGPRRGGGEFISHPDASHWPTFLTNVKKRLFSLKKKNNLILVYKI